jgi:single-strand DNA-binding protein
MAQDFNQYTFTGRLTNDPEIRYIQGGDKAVTKLRIAVNGYKDGEVTYLDVSVWGKDGEHANQYLKKGSKVLVAGRLSIRSYETKDGSKGTAVEVNADRVQFLDSAPKAERSPF